MFMARYKISLGDNHQLGLSGFCVTQIISVITRNYALLASDRLLTVDDGPRKGETIEDDECKLVSLCNRSGIGYSGLARLGGRPTHEWIARTIASKDCRNASSASLALMEAQRVLPHIQPRRKRMSFLMAGWGYFDSPPQLRSYHCVVTNELDQSGNILDKPLPKFDRQVRPLQDSETIAWREIGRGLDNTRRRNLDRNLRRLAARDIGPQDTLRLLVDEIIHTHQSEKPPRVGNKILAFSIPKSAIENQRRMGYSIALARLPDRHSIAFSYFDPEYKQFHQWGPTFVCGRTAATGIKTWNDPDSQDQGVEILLLGTAPRETE